jgi:hypothetical protein
LRLLLTSVLIALGNWFAATPIPDQSLESRETRLQGRDSELLLTFVRKILRWLPEERPVASELWDDEFLEQHNLGEEGETTST